MAKRRILKKNIQLVCGELYAACLLIDRFAKVPVKKEEIEQVLSDILVLRDDTISKISHTEPGSVALYYKKLKEDFNQKVTAIIDTMSKWEA